MAAPGFAPSVTITDDEGRRWRQCAGAAIVNSQGHLLVGERIKLPGVWNCPQGGVDIGETVLAAACREADEEVGLVSGTHIAPVATMSEGVRYEAGGWLAEQGFAGQQLHWTLFRCMDAAGDMSADRFVDLSGRHGESAEFTAARWQPVSEVVSAMWPAKRRAYEALQKWLEVLLADHKEAVGRVDFSGKWARDASSCTGLAGALVARGHAQEEASAKALEPYIQAWQRAGEAWRVLTYAKDGVTLRRDLVYPLGDWEEPFEGNATIFGPAAGVAKRRTAWLAEPGPGGDAGGEAAEPDAKRPRVGEARLLAPGELAHSTLSETPLGLEEARRFLRGGRLVLRRDFTPAGGGPKARSEEIFDRIDACA